MTSGGDAAGMNAAVRAVTRSGLALGWEVFGVRNGYAGLIDGALEQLGVRTVGGIIQRGGTVLGTARCPEFHADNVRRKALDGLHERHIGGLIVIGGDGTQAGALALAGMGLSVVGVASTIDNDLAGSDITIGVDTALNIALEAIDRLKTTASSHHRAFLVEVMGHGCGYPALMAGIAGGAEVVVVPEIETTPEQVVEGLREAYDRGKAHALAVVAEGARYDATALAAHFQEHHEKIGFELRVTRLGHVQRGGAPTAFDRVLATRLGDRAVAALSRGETGVLVGLRDNRVTTTPLTEIVGVPKNIDPALFELAESMAR